jgi:hypothetical protein
LKVQAFNDAVRDAVILAGFGEIHTVGMDKNHFSGPQSEKPNCVDDLFASNLHGRIVLVQFGVVKRNAITTARVRRQKGMPR